MFKMLRPSQARRWTKCAGFVRLAQDIETETSDAADEGLRAHEAAATLFAGGDPVYDDDEMREAVELYITELPTDAKVEETLDLSVLSPGMTGTPDAYHYDNATKVLTIWDFKYGHRFVEVAENLQLACYLIALLRKYPDSIKFRFVIVQPRAYGYDSIRTWDFASADIVSTLQYLDHAAANAISPDAIVETGAHCADCEAAHKCRSVNAASMVFVDRAYPCDLGVYEAAAELTILNLAETLIGARKEALSVQVEQAIRNGANVPGWALTSGRSTQRWSIPNSKVVELGKMFGIDLAKDAVVTPKQAVKAGVPDAVVNNPSATITTNGSLKLKPFVLTSKIAKEIQNGS